MSTIIGVMGQSGHGKTTAMRTLDPNTTFYIDADRKGLSWKGWKHLFNEPKGNYIRESNPGKVWELLNKVNDTPHFKACVVDTVNAIMVDDEMARMHEKGYDKWAELAASVYEMISESTMFRDDLIIIYCFHAEDLVDENGTHFVRFLTSGRKLQKINLESKFPLVLFARASDGKFVFETQARNSTAKTPMGLFDDLEVPNDMGWIIKKLRAYQEENTVAVPDNEQALIERMAEAGLSNFDLIKYCVGKGFLSEGQTILDLDPAVIEKMLDAGNWKKILKAITGHKPHIVEAAISEAAKAVRTMMELSGITGEELEAYMREKGKIEEGQRWHDAEEIYLSAMAADENWEKVSNKIIEGRN